MQSTPTLSAAIDAAVDRIAPLWPLEHFVAVNPFVGLVDQPFADACRLLERTTGAAPLLRPAEYLALYDSGRITDADLAAVAPAHLDPGALHRALSRGATAPRRLLLLSGFADETAARTHWASFVAGEVAKWCATYFDTNQTTWQSPWRTAGLYAGWRELAMLDRNPGAFGLGGFRAFARALPADPTAATALALATLGITGDTTDLLYVALSTVAGWAGYTRYLAHEDRLRSRPNRTTAELLAIRLAYEAALHASGAVAPDVIAAWQKHVRAVAADPARTIDVRVYWQLAYERGFQRDLARQLGAGATPVAPARRPDVQAVFCIDVRSEPLRRHLEAAAPAIDTLGFAGFFGFAVAHAETGAAGASARCPALLAPQVPTVAGPVGYDAAITRPAQGAWKAFQNAATSTFAFVEAAGLGFGPALLRSAAPRPAPRCTRPRPEFDLTPAATAALAQTAAGALRAMSLTSGFAPLVLLCGHGSASVNNPHASSLACGACGGYAGDVNARVAARVLNHPGVRRQLGTHGIHLPADTVFVAGLHDTITDSVHLLDEESVPATHHSLLSRLREALRQAGEATRRGRAASLGLQPSGAHPAAFGRRAVDPAQVRPEWGLANNAAIVVGPRHQTRGADLLGQAFLHEYHSEADADGSVLELILRAPVVVASWINLQYYASRVDPVRYGAGSKILHDVVGGLGVVEGNFGDLRSGLPWQSLHDGREFRHEPRRLSVFISAPRDKIARALDRQPAVRQLFDHGWIHLLAVEEDATYRYASGDWTPLMAADPAPASQAAG